MREGRYRVWFQNYKRMIHFEGMVLCDEYDRLCFDIRESDCTKEYQHLAGTSYIPNESGIKMDSTGLKDKNGKEIYEGDILKTSTGNNRVMWDNKDGLWGFDERCPVYFADINQREVIGNIWEDPELKE